MKIIPSSKASVVEEVEAKRTNWGVVHRSLVALNSAIFAVVNQGVELDSELERRAKRMHMTVDQLKAKALKGIRELDRFDGTFTEYVEKRKAAAAKRSTTTASEDAPEYKISDRVVLKPTNGEKPRTGVIRDLYPKDAGRGRTEDRCLVVLDSQFRLGNEDDGEIVIPLTDIQGLESPKEDPPAEEPKEEPVKEEKVEEPAKEEPAKEEPAEEEPAEEEPAKEEDVKAAILGTEYYTMFKLRTRKLTLTRRNKEYVFKSGDPMGWRFSSNGKFFRLISPFYGANIVFSLPVSPENLTWLARQDPKSKSKKNPKNPK